MRPSNPGTRPRLLLRGDDAGSTRGANDALFAAARDGLVRNIGIMACGPAFNHAAKLFREPPPGVVLGLHATVTSEWHSSLRWGPILPPAQVPTLLAPDGCFVHTTSKLHEQAAPDQILAEVRAQLHHARAAGLRITYLDTHMVFNWLPGVHDRLRALAEDEGLVLDCPSDGPLAHLPCEPLDTYLDRVANLASGESALTIFHPAHLDQDALLMVAQDSDAPAAVARARAAEAAFLVAPPTCSRLRGLPVDFITYADL